MQNQSHCRTAAVMLFALATVVLSASAFAQDYGSSVVGTDFDYITESDPSTFEKLEFQGQRDEEMPDKRDNDAGLFKRAFVFTASFNDNTQVKLVIDAAFESETAAKAEAMRYIHPLGKLPTALRHGVNRLVVHAGGMDTTAFSDVGLIVLYAENATQRISTHDLEETTFHESIHAAWDAEHAKSDAWQQAQAADGAFVTSYAQRNPQLEDLAESALFAYTILHHPDRIPADARAKIQNQIPNRIKFIATLLPPDKPVHFAVENKAQNETRASDSQTNASDGDADQDSATGTACDIKQPGVFADILSNSLMQEFAIAEPRVQKFTADAQARYNSGEALFQAALREFELQPDALRQSVIKFLHVNCWHDGEYNDAAARELIQGWAR